MTENLKGIEEGRAIFAYKCVDEINKNKNVAKKYKSYAKRTPTMIQNNGLGPALAFVYSKIKEGKSDDEKAYKALYDAIGGRLKEVYLLDSNDDLMKTIVKIDSTEYREITMEVLALFSWLRRFVDGMIEGEE